MINKSRKKIGELLIEAGKITYEKLNMVLEEQKKTGRRIGELLVQNGFLVEEDIIEVLEKQLSIPRVDIELLNVETEAVKLIPEILASRYNVFPVAIKGNKLQVVMNDPLNIFAVDDVKISSGMDIEPLLGSKENIKNAISKYYSRQIVKKAADDLTMENINNTQAEDEVDLENIKNAPAVRLVDSIITNAVKARASDIHIEPLEKFVKIRYRIDGELSEVLKPTKEILGALVTRIKILANLNIAEKRLPQDGRIITKVDDKDVDLRVSILPTVHGEKAVIRILTKSNSLIDKKNLGLVDEDLKKLNKIIASPNGIILVTGPTGSGKSTTLYAVLNELNTENKNIITVEDPVEYMLEGVNQVNVNVKAGLTFATGLRSILRQDPDIIMIGEIRDSETAEIAIRSAITGHLVLSTLHTNDAPSAVIRLVDMGIEPYLVATSITGVIAQRLVRRICPHCKTRYQADEYEKKSLGIDKNINLKLFRGKGCSLCSNTGYLGRVGVYEVMEITRNHREYIIQNKSTDDIRDISLNMGMKTLSMACEDLVIKGVTTFDEMMKLSHIKE